jgi:2,3-bisphosphoglycerate-dependent phosphoglycerate mutase
MEPSSLLPPLPHIATPATAAQDAPALWLVRHGESTWNVAGLAQGQHDEAELTERGLRQASDAAGRFRDHPIRAIYASDLRRALQTAAAFAAMVGVPVIPDARLRERMYQRAAAFCDELAATVGDGGGRSVAGAFPGIPDAAGDMVIIAHGGTVRVLAAYLHGIPADQMSWGPVENATVVHIPDFRARLPRSAPAHSQSPLHP